MTEKNYCELSVFCVIAACYVWHNNSKILRH